jgi:hypothetical protein
MNRKKTIPPRPLATKSASNPIATLGKAPRTFSNARKVLLVKHISRHPVLAASFLGVPLGLGYYLNMRKKESSYNPFQPSNITSAIKPITPPRNFKPPEIVPSTAVVPNKFTRAIKNTVKNIDGKLVGQGMMGVGLGLGSAAGVVQGVSTFNG